MGIGTLFIGKPTTDSLATAALSPPMALRPPEDQQAEAVSIEHLVYHPATAWLVLLLVLLLTIATVYLAPLRQFSQPLLITVAGLLSSLLLFLLLRSLAQGHQANALREHCAQLQALLDKLPFGVWFKDQQGRFVVANQPCAAACGLCSVAELIGKTDWQVWSQPLAEAHIASDQAVLRDRQRQTIEVMVNERDEQRWFELFNAPVFDTDGSMLGTAGFTRNITGRKRAELEAMALKEHLEDLVAARTVQLEMTRHAAEQDAEAARHNAMWFGQMAETISEVFWLASADGQSLIYVSPAYEEVWGQPCAELQANPLAWCDALQADEAASIQRALARLAQGVPYTLEYRIHRPDGTLRWVCDRGYPVLDVAGQVVFTRRVVTDITERRQAEVACQVALARAEADRRTLEVLLKYVPEGILIADAPNLEIRHVSPYGQMRLGGPQVGQTAAQLVEQWALYRPDGMTPLAEAELPLVRAIRSGATVRNQELIQISTQGQRLMLRCDAVPIRDSSDRIVAGLMAWRNITDYQQTERRLRCLALAAADNDANRRVLTARQGEEVSLQSVAHESSAVVQIVPDGAGADTQPPAEAPAPADGQDVTMAVNWAGLEARFKDRPDAIGRLVATVLRNHADTAARLHAAIEAGNLDELAFLAHRLRGMVCHLITPELAKLASGTELAARDRQSTTFLLAHELAGQLERLLAELARYAGPQAPSTGAEAEPDQPGLSAAGISA